MRGFSTYSPGVNGEGRYYGVWGHCSAGAGVWARNDVKGNNAYLGGTTYAGDFMGPARVTGYLYKAGGGFMIDHPLDPANKYLLHSFVESPDQKNIYDGIAVLEANGEATVTLPTWFDAVNKEFRYQLTCIGGHAPVFVAREIEGRQFKIAGGATGMKVSWQVTGVRKDPWANANPFEVEVQKPVHERGFFLHPEVFGQPAERSIRAATYPDLPASPRPTPQGAP